MTSQTSTRRHVRQDSASTVVQGGQPASPTLTNPDMILPDYGDPEPFEHLAQPPQPMSGWHQSPDDESFQVSDMFNSGDVQLTTPIIYGNGTMLSDIGEVTEVESNAGGPVRRMASHRSDRSDRDGTPFMSSPPLGAKNFSKRRISGRDRRHSIDSVSTITSYDRDHQPGGTFADFDDGASIDDSNFQGDDEESVIDVLLHEDAVAQADAEEIARLAASEPSGNEDRYSTTSISRRAEEILANAKRRLNTMEGNLTRARGFSYSSHSDGSTISPTFPRSNSAMLLSNTTPPKHGHSRNISEINTAAAGAPKTPPTGFLQRSASALGAAGGYRQPLPMSKSDHVLTMQSSRNGPNHGISQHALDTALEPLSEDDGASNAESDLRDSANMGQLSSPTFGSYRDNPADIPRATSAAQMRDIQESMKGLKGKIHTLREQAAADSMKRRSLQSLRTPSPFTHARWGHGTSEGQPRSVSDQHVPETGAGALGSPFQAEFPNHDDNDDYQEHMGEEGAVWQKSEREPVLRRQTPVRNLHHAFVNNEEVSRSKSQEPELENAPTTENTNGNANDEVDNDDDADQTAFMNGGDQHGAGEDTVSESGDSTYHEALQSSMSHEDREDAFDYQNFFLHSAMGTLSRQGYHRRGSTGTISSGDSVSTTRGPAPTRERRSSIDTTTSMESFETATEGRTSKASNTNGEEQPRYMDVADDDYETERQGPVTNGAGTSYAANGSMSGSDDSASSSTDKGHKRLHSYVKDGRGVSPASRFGLHRPSNSSFESTGTNRSFPLVSRNRLSGSGSTPRDSPEMQLRQQQQPYQQYQPVQPQQSPQRAIQQQQQQYQQYQQQQQYQQYQQYQQQQQHSPSQSTARHPEQQQDAEEQLEDLPNLHYHQYLQESQQQHQQFPKRKQYGSPQRNSVIRDNSSNGTGPNSPAGYSPTVVPLTREDQVLVDRLASSFNRCVGGLTDPSISTTMRETYRRRIDAARRALEGEDELYQ